MKRRSETWVCETKRDLSEPRRIALFIPALNGGGAERVMLTLAKAFADRGLEVDLVVTAARGSLVDDVPSSVRLINLGSSRIITSLPGLIRYLRTQRPTEMLSALSSTNCIAQWAKVLAGVSTRLVVVEHSTVSHSTSNDARRRVRIIPALMRLTYPSANAVVAVSAGVADDLAKTIGLARNRVQVIYNPVVSDQMLKLSHERVDHPWFRDGEPPVILAVGRLTPAKDFGTLIKAFSEIRKARMARLIILGEGELRSDLETLSQRLGVEYEVSLPGFVSNPYAYMRAANLFVLSSRWEGLGNVLIEAMACGVPVISTNCPSGPAEILEGGRFGKLVDVGDVDSMVKAIAGMLDDESHVRSQAMLRAQHFCVEDAVDKYFDVLLGNNSCE